MRGSMMYPSVEVRGGVWVRFLPFQMVCAVCMACGPVIRIIATPPVPRGVAIAAIVSLRFSDGMAIGVGGWFVRFCFRLSRGGVRRSRVLLLLRFRRWSVLWVVVRRGFRRC